MTLGNYVSVTFFITKFLPNDNTFHEKKVLGSIQKRWPFFGMNWHTKDILSLFQMSIIVMASPWGSEMKMSQIHVNKRPVLHYKYRKTPQTLFNHIENFYPKTWYLFVEHFLHLYTVYTIFTVYTALQGLFINDVIIFGGYPRFSLQNTHVLRVHCIL